MTDKITIRATRTDQYAYDGEPHLPQVFCLAGTKYTLPVRIAKRIIALEGAVEVPSLTSAKKHTDKKDELIGLETKEPALGDVLTDEQLAALADEGDPEDNEQEDEEDEQDDDGKAALSADQPIRPRPRRGKSR